MKWKQAIVILRYHPSFCLENHENTGSGYPVSPLRFEPGTPDTNWSITTEPTWLHVQFWKQYMNYAFVFGIVNIWSPLTASDDYYLVFKSVSVEYFRSSLLNKHNLQIIIFQCHLGSVLYRSFLTGKYNRNCVRISRQWKRMYFSGNINK
jgi:hypothetical protein